MSRCIVKLMYLEKRKRLIIWDGGVIALICKDVANSLLWHAKTKYLGPGRTRSVATFQQARYSTFDASIDDIYTIKVETIENITHQD